MKASRLWIYPVIIVTFTILTFTGSLLAHVDLGEPVPLDPAAIHGVLDNGLTYYIRHNEEPRERASFYIVQNVGAVLEEDNQNGLAHFLEHMAFNGTEHFPGKGVIKTLERNGIAFGRELNAYTWFDETSYNISNVPTTDPALLDTCLLILRDWADGLLLTEEEIDKERGVIREEWRTRRNAGFRMFNKSQEYYFRDSKYAERDVIGDLDVIESSDYEILRAFYHDWYRTDLQAIMVVGDFDPAGMEASIKDLFSAISPVENPRPRPTYRVPENSELIYGLVTDPEATSSAVSIYIKHDGVPAEKKTLAYLRHDYVHGLYNSMFASRISELLRKENPPFIYGSANYGGFVARELNAYSISATLNPGEEARGLEAILTENERVRRHGFTSTELERAKANLLTAVETSYNKREKRSHDQFCSSYRGHYLTNEPAPGIEFVFEFVEEILPSIGLEEINALPAAWMTDENRVLVVRGPEQEGQHHLSEAEVVAIMAKVEATEVEPYVDEVSGSVLLEVVPEGGTIVATRAVPDLGAVEWMLGNGATVVYRYSDLTKDEIRFSAYSPGGTSIYPVESLPSARMASSLVRNFGVGDFDATALEKLLAGKNASVSPSIGGLTEGLGGSCSPDDLETMLQLAYLCFENPRFDEAAYEATMQRNRAWIEEARNDPQKAIRDSVSLITNDHHPRAMVFDLDYLDRVDFEIVEKIYRERLKDASDFTFLFVGYMEADEARPLIETYLGAIGDAGRDETWVDNGVGMPEGRTERTILIELNVPKATVHIKYGNEIEYTPENRIHLRIIEEILDLRYTETIREEEGGTYSVSVRRSMSHYPREKMSLTMRFDCDPDEAAHLKSLIYSEIDVLLEKGPSQGDLAKTIENMRKQREEVMQRNGFWMSALRSYYYHGIDIVAPENYDHILDAVTVESVRETAKRMLEGADVVDITFLPLAEADPE